MPRLLALLLLALATPALAQPASTRTCYVFCDPADPRTMNGRADCSPDATQALIPQPSRDAVVRLYAALARGDRDAAVRALDDHAMWTGPAGRAVGADAVARRLVALPPPETLGTDASGRIVATARRPDGQTVRAVWTLLDGRVVGVEQTGEARPERLALDF